MPGFASYFACLQDIKMIETEKTARINFIIRFTEYVDLYIIVKVFNTNKSQTYPIVLSVKINPKQTLIARVIH